jgi:hypothetical protein
VRAEAESSYVLHESCVWCLKVSPGRPIRLGRAVFACDADIARPAQHPRVDRRSALASPTDS